MSDSSGVVNLRSLAVNNPSSSNTGFVANGNDGWNYKYNPCVPFGSTLFTGLAVRSSI